MTFVQVREYKLLFMCVIYTTIIYHYIMINYYCACKETHNYNYPPHLHNNSFIIIITYCCAYKEMYFYLCTLYAQQ